MGGGLHGRERLDCVIEGFCSAGQGILSRCARRGGRGCWFGVRRPRSRLLWSCLVPPVRTGRSNGRLPRRRRVRRRPDNRFPSPAERDFAPLLRPTCNPPPPPQPFPTRRNTLPARPPI